MRSQLSQVVPWTSGSGVQEEDQEHQPRDAPGAPGPLLQLSPARQQSIQPPGHSDRRRGYRGCGRGRVRCSPITRNPPTSGENRAKPLGKQTNRMCHKPRVQTENSHWSQDTYTLPHGGHWALLRIQAWMWYQSWVLLHCDSMCNQSTL